MAKPETKKKNLLEESDLHINRSKKIEKEKREKSGDDYWKGEDMINEDFFRKVKNSLKEKDDISWVQKKKERDRKIIRNFLPSKLKPSKNLRPVYFNNILVENLCSDEEQESDNYIYKNNNFNALFDSDDENSKKISDFEKDTTENYSNK